MKKLLFYSKLFLLISLLGFSTKIAKSQIDELGKFMTGGVQDAEKLFQAYVSPYANGLGASMSAGWYNTAKPHKLGGFDITLTFNTAIVPDADRMFNIPDLNLGEGSDLVSRVTSSKNNSPTIAGENTTGSTLTYSATDPLGGDDIELASFDLPKGTGFKYVPSPMIQASVGFIKGTEIIGRYTPRFDVGDIGSIGLWGVGVKHSLKQWIPAVKRIPVLQLSVMAGYTEFSSTSDISFQPGFYSDFSTNVVSADYSNQQMLLKTSSFTGNLLVSANLPVVCFYGGLGFATTKTNLKMEGNYPFPEINESSGDRQIISKKDPIDISIENSDGSKTKPRLNLGMRLKFAVVTLHFDYTYANYSIATAGLGISFR
ncbi:MAG: DUF6588 family protein [Bacteroidota bacterium]|nr:DUF6588 family protein [Bacteroidota bacterium]